MRERKIDGSISHTAFGAKPIISRRQMCHSHQTFQITGPPHIQTCYPTCARTHNTHTLFPNFFCLLLLSPRKVAEKVHFSCFATAAYSLRMQNTSLRCQTARCGLSYLMLKGVVDVICMLHWCSNSSLNASSAGKNCDCMVGKQTSVLDDISIGLLNNSGWDTWLPTIITLLSPYFTWILPQSLSVEGSMHKLVCTFKLHDPTLVAIYASEK